MTLRSQRGQGTIEFQIISVLVLFPLLMGVIQMGLLVVSKNTLNVAALGAARAGAASGGDHDAMKAALVVGLAPLHASSAKASTGVGMGDITSANYALVMGKALAASALTNPLFSAIPVRNPTANAFADFGVKTKLGTIIPVTNVYDNAAVGARSGQTRADALLLKIDVRYCEELVIPIIKDLILATLNGPFSGASAPDRVCYLAGRVPLTSQSIVRMTVAPIREKLL